VSKNRLFLLFLGLLLLVSAPVRAAGRVFADPTVELERARIVETLGPEWATRWLSLDVKGSGRLVWVIPVVPGTRVDATGADFVWSLESSTAPRVRPPKTAPVCDGKTGSIENTAELSDPVLGPSEIAVLDNASAVAAFVTDRGIGFDATDENELAEYGPFVAVVYDVTNPGWTDALRLALPEIAPPVELAWLGAGVEVALYTLAEGRTRAANIELIDANDLDITFELADEKSNYVSERKSQLVAGSGKRFLPEASGTTPLFGWSVLPNQGGAVEPAVKSYLERVAPKSVDACFGAVLDAVASVDLVGKACAPGALAVVPGAPPCAETVLPGVISAESLRCAAADDLALAFAGFNVGSVRVTRQYTVTGPSSPSPLVLSVEVPFDQSLLVTADQYDKKGCVIGGSGGAPGAGGSGWSGDGGYGNSPYGPDPYPVDEPHEPVHVEVDCWGNTQTGSSDDSCSGDSSSDSEGDTCSGDSSDSSADEDTCGGDSSSSSEGDTCGGDSSSGEGDTCSGDSGSSGGDSCSGDSGGGDSCSSGSSGGSSDCSVAPVRRPRVKVSALTLFLLAIALPLRRVTRKKRR
jgi:hypothetical protein